jgi:2-polyprenyl-3-methyl-5-hydroxy-6-metoxy-1,4-benzoquinol methylase
VIFILGVLQHIPDDRRALLNLQKALSRDGVVVCWVYSDEIGAITLGGVKLLAKLFSLLGPLRTFCAQLLAVIVKGVLPLFPKTHPVSDLAGKPISEIALVIFDQLNPTYSRYYSREEIYELAAETGFTVERIEATGPKGWAFRLSKKA